MPVNESLEAEMTTTSQNNIETSLITVPEFPEKQTPKLGKFSLAFHDSQFYKWVCITKDSQYNHVPRLSKLLKAVKIVENNSAKCATARRHW